MQLILPQTAVVREFIAFKLGEFSPNNDYGQAKAFVALSGKKTSLPVSLCWRLLS